MSECNTIHVSVTHILFTYAHCSNPSLSACLPRFSEFHPKIYFDPVSLIFPVFPSSLSLIETVTCQACN